MSNDNGQQVELTPQNEKDSNKPRVVDEYKLGHAPQFDSLKDLKSMFKSNILVEVPMPNGRLTHFRVKRVDPGTLFMTNRTLIFLLNNGIGSEDSDVEELSAMDILSKLDGDKLQEFEMAMAADSKTKQEVIMANVVEPRIDRELIEALPPETIDALFNAISRGLEQDEDNEELLKEAQTKISERNSTAQAETVQIAPQQESQDNVEVVQQAPQTDVEAVSEEQTQDVDNEQQSIPLVHINQN